MTLSHFIQLKPRFIFCKIRFSQPTKWCSSSTSMSSSENKSNALRKRKSSSVESFANKYMETHTRISGTVTLGQNEIGRSFHTMKDIMLNLKEKIIGKSAAACQNNGPNKCEVGASESNTMNTLSDGSNFSASTTEKSKESLPVETKDMAATTKDVKICSMINEKAHEDSIIDSLGSLKMVGASNEPLQIGDSSIISKLKSDPKPHVKTILQGISTEKLGLTESESRSQSDMIGSNSESKLVSENEIGEKTGSYSNHAEKDMSLSELLMKSLSDCPAVNPKQPVEAFSGTRLRYEIDPNSKSTQSQTKKVLQQFGEEMTSSTACKSHRPDIRAESIALPNNVSEVGILSPISTESAKKAKSLKELFKKRTDYTEAGEMRTEIKTKILTRNIFKDSSTDTREEVAKDSNLSGLINCLKKLPPRESSVKLKPLLDENKAILRFLPLIMEEYEIAAAFYNRADIVKIECSSMKGSKFKTAQVCFKTRDGLKEALKTTYLNVNNHTVTIEAASSLDSLSNRICIPNLIGDPDAPVMLLKNPLKTVMIKGLTDNISSHHIQEALLAFSKSEISAFFFGSSNSVAYVEFKTEEGKERALAEHLILVEGKPLSIFRVDSPRTTVVRISDVNRMASVLKEVRNLCRSYGQVKTVIQRNFYTTDVHFDITEWPNMLKILNRLNGQIIDGHRLQAKAADVFPPEVIHALWGHPEERRRLKGLMRNLFQKLEEDYVAKTDILDLAARYYRDDEA